MRLLFQLFCVILSNFMVFSYAHSEEVSKELLDKLSQRLPVEVDEVGVWKLFKHTRSVEEDVIEKCYLEAKPTITLIGQRDISGQLKWEKSHNINGDGGKIRFSSSSVNVGDITDVSVDISAAPHDLSHFTFTTHIKGYPVENWAVNELTLPWKQRSDDYLTLNEYNTHDIVDFFNSNILALRTTFSGTTTEIIDFYDTTLLDQGMAQLHADHCPAKLDFMSPVWTEFWGTAILLGSGKKRVSLPFDVQTACRNDNIFCFIQDKGEKVSTDAANCSTDPSKCSMIELCAKASGTSAAGEKFWRMDAEFQSYVDMAKIIGVTCGVAPKQVQMVQVDTCDTNASKCSMIDLCAKASVTTSSGQKFWRLDAEFQEYVNAAKTIGVTCGVQQAAVASSQQVTVPKPQKAQKYTNRKALVIGNANYLDQTPLKNPINDAKAVAAKLEQVGFEVTYREDLGVREFGRTLSAYERSLSGSDMSLFYYAGHGIEINKQNYLIPVDAVITAPEDAQYETVMLDQAISASLNTGKLSMVLVDACRDNPFAGQLGSGTRSIGRGLSVVEVETGPVNQIVSFAAASGEVAEDGSGNNSPYATALIELLDEPNLEVGKMFRLLGERVSEMTGGKQQPVKRDNLRGEDIFLVVE